MPDLSVRSNAPEIMDDLACSGNVVHQTLRELEFINRWLGGNHVTLHGLNNLLGDGIVRTQPLEIADLGCGGGDMLRLIHGWAARKKIPVRLTGIDANPNIIQFARENLRDLPEVTLAAEDIFSEAFQARRFDVVIGTLFYHHFTQEQLGGLFGRLKTQARVGLVINDIHRHALAYYSIRWLTRWFSKSAMVKYDAPLSVRRAFRKHELQDVLRAAQLAHARIRWKWAFRWQVVVYLRK